ncbi:hypothetical protein M404DRAFT_1003586 [Pisolithus tinctorius Marx 270]|uniref:Uncharacterized protein n=1 Tax=Pisolithus tinctorius Marx 270 TaxID=870435 RepID=A0A0C3JTW3_PISTI|nr:hypothetical protein M404DRAFT_1003586 [Pisolithus tinctorius Marx 270]
MGGRLTEGRHLKNGTHAGRAQLAALRVAAETPNSEGENEPQNSGCDYRVKILRIQSK